MKKDCGCHSHNGFRVGRSPEGLEQRGVDRAYELALAGRDGYLDKVGSVSGLRRDEIRMIFDEEILDEQHRRFLQGCEEG